MRTCQKKKNKKKKTKEQVDTASRRITLILGIINGPDPSKWDTGKHYLQYDSWTPEHFKNKDQKC